MDKLASATEPTRLPMATGDDRTDGRREGSLLDSEVTTVRLDRRSFLARAAGAGTLAVGAALAAACTDTCDSDTVTDRDAGPFADPINRPRDRTCDKDDY